MDIKDRRLVDSLIRCKKEVKSAPKKAMSLDSRNDYTYRNDFTCTSIDGKLFEVFMRVNTKLPYLFSIGLVYHSENGNFTLCRYNGKHFHKNKIGDQTSFNDFHIHKLYDAQLSNNLENSMDAEITTAYVTFDEALQKFLNDCNIYNWQHYFPNVVFNLNQLKMEGV
jgi:hypothetical protein